MSLRLPRHALDEIAPPAWRPQSPLPTHVPIPVLVAVMVCTIGLETTMPKVWQIQVFIAPAVVLAYVLASRPEHEALRGVRFEPTLVIFATYVGASVFWTLAPGHVGLRTYVNVLLPVIVAHVAAAVYEGAALLRALSKAAGVMAVFVLLDALVRPGPAFSVSGDSPDSLGLRSIFHHKNSLGAALVLVMVLRVAIKGRGVRMAYTLLVFVLLVLSKSSTSMLSAIAALASQWLVGNVARERREGRAGSVFLTGGGAVIVLVAAATLKDRVFALFGKNSSITGRDIIWSQTWAAAKQHLWFGHGINGFWSEKVGTVTEVRHAVGFDVGSSHQGVIELILEYGVVGAVLFGIFFGTMTWRTARLVLRGDASTVVLFAVGVIVGTLVTTMTEAGFTWPGLMDLALVSGLVLTRERHHGVDASPTMPVPARPTLASRVKAW